MRNFVTRLIIMLVIGSFTAVSASALDVSVEFNLANSSIANAVTVNAANNIEVDLTMGDVIALDVVVENAPGDVITAIFTSVITDSIQLTFAGGAFNNILTEATCVGFLCSPATMLPLGAVSEKPNSPVGLIPPTGTTSWVQSVSHTNIDGVNGQGPDVAAVMAYTYNGAGGADPVFFTADETMGDASAGNVGPIVFSSATINVPEPGALMASMASLASVALLVVGRRRM